MLWAQPSRPGSLTLRLAGEMWPLSPQPRSPTATEGESEVGHQICGNRLSKRLWMYFGYTHWASTPFLDWCTILNGALSTGHNLWNDVFLIGKVRLA